MSFEPSSYASAAPSPGPSSGGLAAVAASEEGGDADYFGRVLREREQRAKEEAEQKKEFATKGAHRTEFHELHKQLKYCNTTTRELDEVIVANCRIRSGTIETDLDVAEEPEGIKQTFIHLLKGKGRAASGAKSVSSSASKSIDTSKWRKMQGLRRSTNSEGGVEMSSRHPSSASDVTTTTIQRRPKSVSLVDARLRLAVGFINDAKAGRGARLHRRNVRAMAAYHLHNSIGVRVVVMVVALLQMMVTPWEPLSIRQASLPLSKQIQDNDVGYWWTTAVDIVACVVYILFLLLKFYHLGMWQFWRKGWNRFYFGLVILSTIDLLLKPVAVIPPISMPLRPFMVVCLSQKLRHAVIVFGRTLIAKGTLNVMLQIGILIIVFSVFGVYWMAGNASWWEGDGVCSFCNFNDTLNSMLSFYVLSTSENYPDVMVPALTRAYEERGVFDFPVFLFLIAFIFVYQIFLLNVVIAVFVDVYNSQRRQQIVAQRVRERKGLLAAFRALDHDSTGFLSYDTYSRLIRRLLPKLTPGQTRMTFDVMDVDGNNQIDVMEFFELLDVMVLRFRKPMVEKVRRIEDEGVVSRNIMRVREALHSIVHTNKSKIVFGVFSALLTIASIVVLYGIADQGLALQLTGGSTNNNSPSSPPLPPSLEAFVWASFFISLLMVAEIGVRMLAVKPQRFWSSMWDVFDTVLVFISFLAEIIGLAVDPVGNGVINAVRALRVLRLITISDRSKLFARVFLDTAVSLVPYIYLALASGFVFVVVGSFIFEPLEYDIKMNQTYYASSGAVVNMTATSGSFQTFSTSFLLLFQMLTQSNWFEPMYIYMERVNIWAPAAWPIASVYFVTFNFLMVLLLMNLISALVIKIFQAKQELEMESKDILVEAVSKRKTRWSVSSPTGSRPSIAAQRPSADLHLPPSGGDPRPAERRSLREEEGMIERAASYRESAGGGGSDVFVMERKKRLSTEMFQKEMIGKDELGQAVLDEDRKEKGTKKGGVDRSIDAALHKQRQAAEKAHSVRAEKGEKNRTAKRRVTDIINDLSVLPNPTAVPKLPKSTGEVAGK